MSETRHDPEAVREAWQVLSPPGRRGDAPASWPGLPAPGGLSATGGAGQVSLTWDPVPGAAGYLVERSPVPDGPYTAVDHGGGDVLAVPGPHYADTTGLVGRTYWYRVKAVLAVDAAGAPSPPVPGTAGHRRPDPLALTVHAHTPQGSIRPVWRMLGSEHLSQLDCRDHTGGRSIGAEFLLALTRAHKELGMSHVRAHGILGSVKLTPPRGEDGATRLDFSAVDALYETLLAHDIRPVVELSFMPPELARDPEARVFTYPGVVSPPARVTLWAELVERLARHLVERFGLDEVAGWAFEVWNEPNLPVFWQGGGLDDYLALYAASARSLRKVSPRLRVGGPGTAAAGWIEEFLAFVERERLPLDFLSTHAYGTLPLDLTGALERHGRAGTEIWWTEWGVTPTHFLPVNDLAFGAPFTLAGLKAAQRTADRLAYWVVSDHFEELGRPPRFLHGGFGLLTVGNLAKPRYWAIQLAQALGPQEVAHELAGDGARTLVDAWTTRHRDGTVDVLAWNGTLDQSKQSGHPLLDRTLAIRVEGLEHRVYRAHLARVDATHSSVAFTWSRMAGFSALPSWPTARQLRRLRAADRLAEEDLGLWTAHGGVLATQVDLPMPGVVRLRLVPGDGERVGGDAP